MPELASSTDPGWLPLALERFDEVLCDHAHCEKKAASQAISLLATWPERVKLVQAMARLAHEELSHFRQVYDRLTARGLTLTRDHGDPYVKQLHKLVRHKYEETRFVDKLLIAGLVEARSHERLALLADGLADPDLKAFYRQLATAEAGHARLFTQLAETYADPGEVAARAKELAQAEAEVVANRPLEPRIH